MSVTHFFYIPLFVFFPKRQQDENLDDGGGPDKEMGESGGVGGGKVCIEQCDDDGDSGGVRGEWRRRQYAGR